MCSWANENFRGGGGERGGKKVKLRKQPPAGEGEAPGPLFPAPAPTRAEVRSPRGNRAGRGRPARSPPPAATPPRGASLPGARRGLARRGPAAGSARPAPRPGRRAARPPAEGKGIERGSGCKQPQRPGLASTSPASQAPPRAARTPGPRQGRPCRGPRGRRGAQSLPGRRRQLVERSRRRRRGKSGLTCHYFLRHLGSTCQRPHKALWECGLARPSPPFCSPRRARARTSPGSRYFSWPCVGLDPEKSLMLATVAPIHPIQDLPPAGSSSPRCDDRHLFSTQGTTQTAPRGRDFS